jgi:L-methionine (R)-S-oxide reductase
MSGYNDLDMTIAPDLNAWLQNFIKDHQAAAGSVHLFERDGLKLAAAVNIPPPVQQAVAWVPNGKGMAGLALQRKEPVQTCNLQEDRFGNVKPGAKAVNAQAAVALPIMNSAGDVRAVVGIAYRDEREFTSADLENLTASASTLPA